AAVGSLCCCDPVAFKRIPLMVHVRWCLVVGNTAIQRAPPVISRHLHDLTEASRQPARVVFLGDSLTELWLREGREIWNANFVGLGCVALGVGGDRTQNLLYRIRSGEFNRFSPEAVVLLIGTNNVNRNTPPEIAEAVALIVNELKTLWPRAYVLVVAIPPREMPRSREVIGRIHDANRLLA